MSSDNVSTRFMIISDTHNFQFGQAEKFGGPFRLPTPRCDVLLHCGDLTSTGGPIAYKKLLKMLASIEAELKLVIAGNHDLDLDRMHWEKKLDSDTDEDTRTQPEKAFEVMTGPLAKEAGVTYLVEGINTFTLSNGAKFRIYTSPYQPDFCDWAFPYERDEDRFNPPEHVAPNVRCIAEHPIPDFPGVDIMMTHGPPKDILDWTAHGNVGCEALLRAVSRARPLLYCFGHIHEAYGARVVTWKDNGKLIGDKAIEEQSILPNDYPEKSNSSIKRRKQTLMVNAAIMNLSYRPTNAPWLIDLDLPRAG
ncbi:Metallo-dependent phosphatase-like protein [Cadophora sp. MPI-SDFR-AT-0126]|nr:Metallo-dependent phosphatase-like protein [Leotiomycetes sp. MPI-SDFR-AT-0126]